MKAWRAEEEEEGKTGRWEDGRGALYCEIAPGRVFQLPYILKFTQKRSFEALFTFVVSHRGGVAHRCSYVRSLAHKQNHSRDLPLLL